MKSYKCFLLSFFFTTESTMLFLKNFLKNDEGATAIEYGLIVALIAVVIIPSLTNVGAKLQSVFTTISASL